MEQHSTQLVPPEAAEVLIYEAIYLLIAPSLHTNEKLLFELNMALVKELEENFLVCGTIFHPMMF